MKRAVAIVLSLMILWLQAVASAPTNFTSNAATHGCCSCNKSCCVSQSTANPQPLPVAPISASASHNFSALVVAVVSWTLPSSASLQVSSSDGAPISALAVPLFTRHCALLI